MTQDQWDEFFDKSGRYYLRPHEAFSRVIARFNELNIKKVIDLGCGSGRHIMPLSEEGYTIEGVDFSPSAIELANKWLKSKNLNVRLTIADIHDNLKFIRGGSFDSVLAVNSIHYTQLNTFEKTIKEINRILKTGGLLFLVVPSIDSQIKDLVTPQLFFKKEQIIKFLENTFRILEFSQDKNQNWVILAQEK